MKETQTLKNLIRVDYAACFGESGQKNFILAAYQCAEFRVVFLFRLASLRGPSILSYIIKKCYRSVALKYCITIKEGTAIGAGFRIGHLGPIVIHPKSIIGEDVTICQGVTLGKIHRGRKSGVPTIGNHVYIAANASVIGMVKIGSYVVIAPGAFVNFDVPDHSIVIGNPGVIHRKKYPVLGMTHQMRQNTEM